MDHRDYREDRAINLLKQIEPELLKILRTAPAYGSCGLDATFHQNEITRIVIRAEVSRKLDSRAGSAGFGHGA